MKLPRKTINILAIAVIVFIPGLAGCSSMQDTENRQVDAVIEIRKQLELPELPFAFVEMTGMINSPSGDLEVALYQDNDGRKYFVDPATNQVVEIDARTILPNIAPDAPNFSAQELKAKTMKYFRATISGFENLQPSWQYEEGQKGSHYFFTWYGEAMPGSMNRPFAQIGFHQSGVLFAYYNTLSLDE